MNPGLFFSIWVFAAGLLLTGIQLSHQHYNQLMRQDVHKFESAWKKWEKTYERP